MLLRHYSESTREHQSYEKDSGNEQGWEIHDLSDITCRYFEEYSPAPDQAEPDKPDADLCYTILSHLSSDHWRNTEYDQQ